MRREKERIWQKNQKTHKQQKSNQRNKTWQKSREVKSEVGEVQRDNKKTNAQKEKLQIKENDKSHKHSKEPKRWAEKGKRDTDTRAERNKEKDVWYKHTRSNQWAQQNI